MSWVSALLLASALATPEPAPLAWFDSYDKAVEASAKEKKPLLVFFGATWCGWCKAMENDSFADPAVRKLLDGFVKAKVDIDEAPRVAFAFRVTSVPRLVTANVHGEITGDSLGFLDPEKLSAFLKDAESAAGGPRLPSIEKDAPVEEAPAPVPLYGQDALAALGDPDPRIRAAATEAFLARGQDAIAELRQALAGDYLGTRIAAFEALEKLGAAPKAYDPWAPRAEREESLKNEQ